MKKVKKVFMDFRDLFKDDNNINEKSIVGFIAFIVMIVFAFADLLTGYFGKDLVINEFIYDSFLWIVLGCFGIAEAGRAINPNNKQ
jgi:hypothetical protein|tara:strand:- start:430 stop:687 length:258 start_codon:yes stop_codon:yes gene_type:complete